MTPPVEYCSGMKSLSMLLYDPSCRILFRTEEVKHGTDAAEKKEEAKKAEEQVDSSLMGLEAIF